MIKVIKSLIAALMFIPMISLVAMVIVEMIGIAGPLTGAQVSGTVEITAYLSALVISFCIFYATIHDANVAVTFLVKLMPEPIKRINTIFVHLISIVFFIILIFPGQQYAWKMLQQDEKTLLLNIPVTPFRFVFILGLLMTLMSIGFELFKLFQGKEAK